MLLVRLHQGDAQCLVAPNSGLTSPACEQLSSTQEAKAQLAQWYGSGGESSSARRRLQQLRAMPRRTLTCGAESLALLGATGYESEGGWCSRARAALLARE